MRCARCDRSSAARRGGSGVRAAAALPPRRQLTTARVHTAAFRVIEAVDRQAFLTLPPLHRANAAAEIRGNLLPGVEARLVRRVVALEPPAHVVETVGASSFRLAVGGEGPRRISMTTYSRIVISCGALI